MSYRAQVLAFAAALVSLVLAGVSASTWLQIVVASLAWAGLAATAGTQVRPGSTEIRAVIMVVLLIALGSGSAAVARKPVLLWWAVLLLVAAVAAVSPIVALAPRVEACHLAGCPPPRGASAKQWLSHVGLVAVPVAIILRSVDAAAWVWLGMGGVAALTTAGGLLLIVDSRRRREQYRKRIRDALAAYSPVLAFYTARRSGGAYQLDMWLRHVECAGSPFVIIVRHAEALQAVSKLTSAPVVVCSTWADLDRVMVPSLKVALYVNSLGANADFITYRQLQHVYLGHGESDKVLSVHPMHAVYDHVFVAGRAAIERYEHAGVRLPPGSVRIVGRPQVAALDVVSVDAHPPVRTVLYAPTWAGYNRSSSYSSLASGTKIVSALIEHGCTVIFRPHPFSRIRRSERVLAEAVDELLRADAARTGRQHRCGTGVDSRSFAEAANASDAMVSDISSVLSDYLWSRKPIAVVSTSDNLADFEERHHITAATYTISADLENLSSVLIELTGRDGLKRQRMALREAILGGGEEPTERFLKALEEVRLQKRSAPALEGWDE